MQSAAEPPPTVASSSTTAAAAAPDPGGIGQLFAACDLDGSGYIDRDELSVICNELTGDELADVFRQLDCDGDGKISLQEFADGFQAMRDAVGGLAGGGRQQPQLPASERVRRVSMCLEWRRNSREWSSTDRELLDVNDGGGGRSAERRKSLFDLVGSLDEGFTALSCQEQICEMYQQLHDAGLSDQLAKFEDIVVNVIKDVRKHQCENERLEKSYQREKEQHARHLQHLEEDLDAQIQRAEQRVRNEEREKHEAQCEELKSQHNIEIEELQSNLKRLQTLDGVVLSDKPNDDLRSRVDELLQENRALKRNLTDAQTTLALARSEIATMKVQYEEKCYELDTEKQALVEYMKEHDNLTRQIHMLHDANKSLHDTNDDLREALETARNAIKRPRTLRFRVRRPSIVHMPPGRNAMLRSMSAGSRGEYVRRYLQDSAASPTTDQCLMDRSAHSADERGEATSLAEELDMMDDSEHQDRHLLPAQDSCEMDSSPEDIDSGRFTMRDVQDEYSDDEGSAAGRRRRHKASSKRQMFRTSSAVGSQMAESFDTTPSSIHGGGPGSRYRDDVDLETTSATIDEADGCHHLATPGGNCSHCSRSSSFVESPESPGDSLVPAAAIARKLSKGKQKITQEAERVFKIVLAGDAAVGKSSFIMRLCKNKFFSNLNSTLGVDFQTKTLEVDGRVIALQLWDTAGQERFRSIAKSYFRRADGVLLLYDVSYERSFLSVRDWLEAIEEGAQKKIPIMLVGNKCDMRDESAEGGKSYVKPEDGQRLAREFIGLFIESSAKDGKNVLEAVTELSRLLMTNEDLEVKSIGLKLQDVSSESGKKKSPCCNM